MEEREIDLIDLIADVLSHWRGVLVCMLVGALLMGVLSYVKSYGGTEEVSIEEEISPEERVQEVEELLKDSEKMAVRAVIDDEKEYVWYQQYIESSVLMQADPYNIYKKEMLFKIQMDDMGQSYMLRSVYEDLVNGVGMLQWVEEQTGISATSADELISAQAKSNVLVLNGVQQTELGNDCLKVVILHSGETECENLARAVKDYIEQQHEKLTQELGEHEVDLLSEATSVVMDTGIRDRQMSYSNTKITLLTNCAKAKEAFTEEQQIYYDLLKGGDGILEEDGEAAVEEEVVVAKPSVSIKYVIVGAVLFAVIYVGVFFIIYILNGKLRATDELQKLYHISQLGLIVKDGGKKKIFVDRWIDALRNRNKRQFTREQSLELAATAVKISAGKQGLDTICFMGCDLKAGAEAVCRKLKDILEVEKFTVMILDNVLYDAEAMEKLESVKGIVLVEKAASTMYDEITRELELVSRQGIKVLGGIIVE